MTEQEIIEICEDNEFDVNWNDDKGIMFRAEVKRMAIEALRLQQKYQQKVQRCIERIEEYSSIDCDRMDRQVVEHVRDIIRQEMGG